MTQLEKVHLHYSESRENDFWDAWGICLSLSAYEELREECAVRTDKGSFPGKVISVDGLRVIALDIADDKMFVVDEQLGRAILSGYRGMKDDKENSSCRTDADL